MLIHRLLYTIIPFEAKSNNIFKEHYKDLIITASGSIGQYYNHTCVKTNPEQIFDNIERKTDWCSNINKTKTDNPWVSVHMNSKKMVVTGYALRAGCCYYGCCCMEDGKRVFCCCDLYSWSLQGSNDNLTWITLHSVQADRKFYDCANRQYDITPTGEAYKYIRIIQDQPWPGCNFCICLNKFELYGKVDMQFYDSDADADEDVSIIGKVTKNDSY